MSRPEPTDLSDSSTTTCEYCTSIVDAHGPGGHVCKPFDMLHKTLYRTFAAAVAGVPAESIHALLMCYQDVRNAQELTELFNRVCGLEVIRQDVEASNYMDSLQRRLERFLIAGTFPTFTGLHETQRPWFRDIIGGTDTEMRLIEAYNRINTPAAMIHLLRGLIPKLSLVRGSENKSAAARLLLAEIAHFASKQPTRPGPGVRRAEAPQKSSPRKRLVTRQAQRHGTSS